MNKRSPTRSDRSASKAPPPARMAEATKQRPSAARRVRRIDGDARHEMIAQGAYFRAERRGFAAGRELDDWLEAERELAQVLDG